jgi:hypothetical protein
MDNNFKNKYLKYKQKYNSLKEQNKNNINVLQNTFNSIKNKYQMKYQIGGVLGVHINTIPNNGSTDVNNSLQCIWISIKDYLNYHRGEIRTVRALKELVGLPATTDNIQYDDANVQLRRGLELLCELLDISIHFIGTSRDGTIIPFNLENNRMIAHHFINRGNPNILYIAAFGDHFELIIKGPSNYVLARHLNSTIGILPVNIYQPKVLIKKKFISPSTITDINELQLLTAITDLIEIQQRIDFFKEGLNELNKVGTTLLAILKNIKQANISFGSISKINEDEYVKLNLENIREIGDREKEIKELEQHAASLKLIINY